MNMDSLPICVIREFKKLVPASLHADTTCVAFYDNYPIDPHKLDIIIGTGKSEIIEFFKRQPVNSFQLDGGLVPRDITLHRNSKSILLYFVSVFNKLHILKRSDSLTQVKVIENVDRYVIDDPACTGIAQLRVWFTDDAVSTNYDEDFNIVNEILYDKPAINENNAFVTSLRVKLSEAKYTVAVNKKKCEELMNLRQAATYALMNDMLPVCHEEILAHMKVTTPAIYLEKSIPWIKLCNEKVVLSIPIENKSKSKLDDISVMLQSSNSSLSHYVFKMYESTTAAPYWELKKTHSLDPSSKATAVICTNLDDFAEGSIVKYIGVILYKVDGRIKYAPFEEVVLSCLDVVGEDFDVISNSQCDKNSMLAIMATSEKYDLNFSCLPSISGFEERNNWKDIFKKYLGLGEISEWKNVVGSRKSPYHILNGITIIIHSKDYTTECDATIFSRTETQFMSFITALYDAVPYRIHVGPHKGDKKPSDIPTSMDIDIFSSEDSSQDIAAKPEIIQFGKELSSIMSKVLEYFDKCMILMGESKDAEKRALLGSKIDLFIGSRKMFDDFSESLKKDLEKLSCIASE